MTSALGRSLWLTRNEPHSTDAAPPQGVGIQRRTRNSSRRGIKLGETPQEEAASDGGCENPVEWNAKQSRPLSSDAFNAVPAPGPQTAENVTCWGYKTPPDRFLEVSRDRNLLDA